MKKLATLFCLLPGTVLAHGGHPPVNEALHGPLHGVLLLAFAGVAVLGAVLWFRKSKSR